ncbi:MAG: thiopurine S-methyltransferase [Rhodobacteraceae bacterium]|nr:thiopurine S-methyltransferase [Paracoccaceae bacterium]
MESSFWHQRWSENRIGFHAKAPNSLLEKNFSKLSLPKGSRVFLPLCGKTLDIAWFLTHGYRVVGAELSETAVEQLFEELGVAPEITTVGNLRLYSAQDIDIFVGDIFDLTAEILGPVDMIYDRAALVALPPDMRSRYAAHIPAIANYIPQFLICFEYDQSLMDGPPFSIDQRAVAQLYSDTYQVMLAEREEVAGGFQGKFPATEAAWLLKT